MLRSPTGTDSFCVADCNDRAAKQVAILQKVGQLPDAQVGYYLLRFSCGAGRLTYMARTTPVRLCGQGLRTYDDGMRNSFSALTGLQLDTLAWEQATLPAQAGGLGLRPTVSIADVAYIGSRAVIVERGAAVWPPFSWDIGAGSDLHAALGRCWNTLRTATSPNPFVYGEPSNLTQHGLSAQLGQCAHAGSDDQCRLHAYRVDGSATVLGLTPSFTLDTTAVGSRLGVDVCGGGACRFCGKTLDCKGRHASSCMAGGDHVTLRNSVRDLIFDYCQRAQLRPQLEAAGILDGRRRLPTCWCG